MSKSATLVMPAAYAGDSTQPQTPPAGAKATTTCDQVTSVAQLLEASRAAERAKSRARRKHPRTWVDDQLEGLEKELGI
ncbi:MAG: hypothetical protein FWD65_04370 [Coriobacteriia bacterium]|nr:hypothetical protein [Coriobacteriia bacterium]